MTVIHRGLVVSAMLSAIALGGCSFIAGGSESPLTSTLGAAAADVTVAEQAQAFLDAVCPSDSAIHLIEASSVVAGGWSRVDRDEIRTYTDAAVQALEESAEKLSQGRWGQQAMDAIDAVRGEYLAMVGPASALRDATDGPARSRAWQQLRGSSRSAEARLRLTLSLPAVGSVDDGCPPPPPLPSRNGLQVSWPEWTEHWSSPSGRIDCGFSPDGGGPGIAMVACVTESGRYASLILKGDALPQFRAARKEDYSSLSVANADTLGYGRWRDGDLYQCWQSPPDGPRAIGMSCGPAAGGSGFSIYSAATATRMFKRR